VTGSGVFGVVRDERGGPSVLRVYLVEGRKPIAQVEGSERYIKRALTSVGLGDEPVADVVGSPREIARLLASLGLTPPPPPPVRFPKDRDLPRGGRTLVSCKPANRDAAFSGEADQGRRLNSRRPLP
jgi:hypothetical protein